LNEVDFIVIFRRYIRSGSNVMPKICQEYG